MDLGLEGARVLVTGGASNIGRAIVHDFALERARIVIADIDAQQADRVRLEALALGAEEVQLVIGDLTVPGAGEDAVDCLVSCWSVL